MKGCCLLDFPWACFLLYGLIFLFVRKSLRGQRYVSLLELEITTVSELLEIQLRSSAGAASTFNC